MLNNTGQIGIHTDNLFPIIKQWLYSDRDIFLRELLSNSVDAIHKRNKIASIQADSTDQVEPEIRIKVDQKSKIITISDNGVGMDESEVQKYINQIASSSAEDFVKKFQNSDESQDIIGHFGLGFYSAFMVADKVELETLSYQKGAKPVRWSCDGSIEYQMGEGKRQAVGTDVILWMNKDSKEFLKQDALKALILKYAQFLPVSIYLEDELVNHKNPLWVQTPKDTTDEDYKAFYKILFPMEPDPLFWIHLNVDYPFRLQGILYFPKITQNLESRRGRVKLYCQQVFVTDQAETVVPEFLTLLQGCIDCPDFPLNVSRSALQNDPYVQKISKHIVKKVAEKLNQLFKNNRQDFETYWDSIHPFIKYGAMNQDDFYTRVKELFLFKTTKDEYKTLAEYKEAHQDSLQNTVIYTKDSDSQTSYIDMLQEQNIQVLVLDSLIDSYFVQFIESKESDLKFQSVEAAASEYLTNKSAENADESDQANDEIATMFKTLLDKEHLEVHSKSFKSNTVPAMISQDEMMKRFQEMAKTMPGRVGMSMPSSHSLLINRENEMVKRLYAQYQANKDDLRLKELAAHVYDLALMSQEPLSGKDMKVFLNRSIDLLSRLL